MLRFLSYVAILFVAQILFQRVETISSLARRRVKLAYKEASDLCGRITPSSHSAALESANWACDEAFKALDDVGFNSCKGWRNAACRLSDGLSQCSCIISSCGYYDIKSDVTKTFRQCAYKILIDEIFTGESLLSERFQDSVPRNDETLETRQYLPVSSYVRGSSSKASFLGASSSSALDLNNNLAQEVPINTFGAENQKQQKPEFFCKFCKLPYSSNSNLRKHFKNKHPKEEPPEIIKTTVEAEDEKQRIPEFYCKSCKKDFSTKGTLVRHFREKHPGSEEGARTRRPWAGCRNFICNVCGAAFSREKALIEHREHHPGNFECHPCGLNLGSRRNLERHNNLTHPEIEQRSRGEAGPSTGVKRKLTIDHYCHICQRKLCDRWSYVRHVKRRHVGMEAAAFGVDTSFKRRTSDST